MKNLLMVALAALVAIAALGFNHGTANAEGYEKITPQEAKARMATQGTIVVDVRTQDEYKAGHIKGAVLLPLDLIVKNDAAVAQALPEKDAEILVYCRSGRRSQQAANALLKLGYTTVYDFGGIMDWPYEVVK